MNTTKSNDKPVRNKLTLENLYLVLNLGCEMIYVIDQRLTAQSVSLDKSSQVLRDLTEVLLDHKFLNYITMSYENQMLTIQQARILLTDIACCSLMRLDMNSMDKLWELMVMMFKWQLFVADHPQTLMDITFRHLDGIARLIPEMRKSILVDATKQIIIEYWDQLNDNGKGMIVNNLKQWLKPFNTKISILMRLALQHNDASFVVTPINNEFYDHYSMNLGTNIYAKTAHLQSKDLSKATRPPSSPPSPVTTHEFDMLFDQLGIPSQGAITEASTDQKQVIKEQVPNMLSLSEMLGDVTVRVNNEEREEEQEEDTQGTTLLEMFMKSLNEGQTSSSEFGDLV